MYKLEHPCSEGLAPKLLELVWFFIVDLSIGDVASSLSKVSDGCYSLLLPGSTLGLVTQDYREFLSNLEDVMEDL